MGADENSFALKTCPVCKEKLFADMDTCFNCMHRFGLDGDAEVGSDEALDIDEPRELVGEYSREGATGRTDTPNAEAQRPFQEKPLEAEREKEGSREEGSGGILVELLVEFDGFLRQFLLKRGIDVE